MTDLPPSGSEPAEPHPDGEHRRPGGDGAGNARRQKLISRAAIVGATLVGCLVGGIIALVTTGGNASPKHQDVAVPTAASTQPVVGSTRATQQPPGTAAPSSSASSSSARTTTAPPPKPVAPRTVTAAQLAALPRATTYGRVPAAPADTHPTRFTSGGVVHPKHTVPIYAAPGGAAIAAFPSVQVGASAWFPVVAEKPDWFAVLLPSKPNGRLGWVWAGGHDLAVARSPYQIHIDLGTFTMTVDRSGKRLGSWTVGQGMSVDPTPRGRTFILGQFSDVHQDWSPYILPLGIHSQTEDTFGGGPGTVAIHTWLPDPSVYGTKSSNGCIRVPPDALTVVRKAPLGTLVIIT